ncbi:uncharacterized protein [Hoplias malabaricus]|uniref:uncharacterized protein n=1 Tax=Hoplias malabaricus TaxID=27720 RepID=UPI00346353BC
MVCSAAVVGLFLFSLNFFSSSGAEINNLPQIIKFLQENYGDGEMFAVAINIPSRKCSSRGKLNQNILPKDPSWKVKHGLHGIEGVYSGQSLIGAKTKTMDSLPEYQLLIQSDQSENGTQYPRLKKLLDKNKNGCVVFYSFQSPCVSSCPSPRGRYSIMSALDLFQNHTGPKAFVFKQVYKHKVSSVQRQRPLWHCYRHGPNRYAMMSVWENYADQIAWQAGINQINARVPLFRCSAQKCIPCIYEREVDGRCMHPVKL